MLSDGCHGLHALESKRDGLCRYVTINGVERAPCRTEACLARCSALVAVPQYVHWSCCPWDKHDGIRLVELFESRSVLRRRVASQEGCRLLALRHA